MQIPREDKLDIDMKVFTVIDTLNECIAYYQIINDRTVPIGVVPVWIFKEDLDRRTAIWKLYQDMKLPSHSVPIAFQEHIESIEELDEIGRK